MLIGNSKYWVGGRRSRVGEEGEEGGDVEGDEGGFDDPSGMFASALQQGVMVCDSTYMITPNSVLPGPLEGLQDWQRRQRRERQRAGTEGEAGGAGAEASLLLGHPLARMMRLVEQVHAWCSSTAASRRLGGGRAPMSPPLEAAEAHRLRRLVAYTLVPPVAFEDGFYDDPDAPEPVGGGHLGASARAAPRRWRTRSWRTPPTWTRVLAPGEHGARPRPRRQRGQRQTAQERAARRGRWRARPSWRARVAAAARLGWPKLHEDGRGPLQLGLPPPNKKVPAKEAKEEEDGACSLKEAMRLTVRAAAWTEEEDRKLAASSRSRAWRTTRCSSAR